VRIELPSGLPALTIHRLILIVLMAFWLARPGYRKKRQEVPLLGLFAFWAGVNLLVLIVTYIQFTTSLKSYLDFVFEILLFYMIVSTSLLNPEDAFRLLRGVWVGITIVALFAVIEKYTRFNPVDRFLPGYAREEGSNSFDVLSTFPHRILLGTGMAMGWPVALALILRGDQESVWQKRRLWISIVALLSSCYFSMSRGPWVAVGISGLALAFLGSWRIRKRILFVGVLAGFLLLAKPSVFQTFLDMVQVTTDVDSAKGGTARYRLELWKIAWAEVTKSPVRFLFGYGQGAGREMDLTWELSYRGKEYQIFSWDNHFACDLFQSGTLGLLASLLLYGGALLILYRTWKTIDYPDKDVLACLLASALVLFFMMTNVLIYAKQLYFMFWSLAAVGIAIGNPSTLGEELPAPAEFETGGELVTVEQQMKYLAS
jgi:O-antigen ligase